MDGILLLVNEEGLMKERPLTNQRASEMAAAELVGPAVVAAKRGDELIGFAKSVAESICAEWEVPLEASGEGERFQTFNPD